jgi:hypothetical protein
MNSVRTSKRTPHITITKINWLTLFKEIIPVYTVNHIQSAELMVVKEAGTYIYHSALKGIYIYIHKSTVFDIGHIFRLLYNKTFYEI